MNYTIPNIDDSVRVSDTDCVSSIWRTLCLVGILSIAVLGVLCTFTLHRGRASSVLALLPRSRAAAHISNANKPLQGVTVIANRTTTPVLVSPRGVPFSGDLAARMHMYARSN